MRVVGGAVKAAGLVLLLLRLFGVDAGEEVSMSSG
jgi:hypothetical protein